MGAVSQKIVGCQNRREPSLAAQIKGALPADEGHNRFGAGGSVEGNNSGLFRAQRAHVARTPNVRAKAQWARHAPLGPFIEMRKQTVALLHQTAPACKLLRF